MRTTIAEHSLDDKVCQQMDLGMVQEVIPPDLITELLETYQMWEEREQKTNMVSIVYWPMMPPRTAPFRRRGWWNVARI